MRKEDSKKEWGGKTRENPVKKSLVTSGGKKGIRTFSSNWRLIQLMTSIENGQGRFSMDKGSLAQGENWKNEVVYKNIYRTNPLIPAVKEGKDQVSSERPFLEAIDSVKRFPIQASFVAQWLSENIVSSKTYKLSLLCDRVIKASNLGVKKVNKSSGKQFGESLVGIKIIISGRILGAEIATSKTFKAGQIPSNTIEIAKDAGFALAKTRSGTIGIKVIYFWKSEK